MAIGRGDASIGPSWAPCEVSAELSIVGATSGGSDVGGGASQSSQVWSQARLATRTVLRVIQGGRRFFEIGGVTDFEEEGPEITVTGATRLKSKHTILPPYTKIVTSSNLASGPFSYHSQHRSQRRRHEKGRRSASR